MNEIICLLIGLLAGYGICRWLVATRRPSPLGFAYRGLLRSTLHDA